MWEDRADRVRREVAALSASGTALHELQERAVERLDDAIGTDLACCATLDPDDHAITGMVSGHARIPVQYEPLLVTAEQHEHEPNTFAALAARRQRAARLSDLEERERRRSLRLQTVWRPLGIDHELRVPLLVDRRCWGVLALVRSGPDFSAREVDVALGVAPALASAVRAAMLTAVGAGGTSSDGALGPALVVVTPHGTRQASTGAADRWRERLERRAPGRFEGLLALAAAGATASRDGAWRLRVQDGDGQWSVLRAARLEGAVEPLVAVTLEPLGGAARLRLAVQALGLTAREQEVCRQVLAGAATAEIADRLTVSALTVQDHLKAVFAKAGVHSRGELVALLHPVEDGSAASAG